MAKKTTEEKFVTTDGHVFAYKEDADEHQVYINRMSFIDSLMKERGV
jgi:hypothetical protein